MLIDYISMHPRCERQYQSDIFTAILTRSPQYQLSSPHAPRNISAHTNPPQCIIKITVVGSGPGRSALGPNRVPNPNPVYRNPGVSNLRRCHMREPNSGTPGNTPERSARMAARIDSSWDPAIGLMGLIWDHLDSSGIIWDLLGSSDLT